MMGGDFTPWTEFCWGGNDGGGLEPAGGGIFGQASGTRGSPPSTENPAEGPPPLPEFTGQQGPSPNMCACQWGTPREWVGVRLVGRARVLL